MALHQPNRTARDVAADNALRDKLDTHRACGVIYIMSKAAGRLIRYMIDDCWETNGRYYVRYFDFSMNARQLTGELAVLVTRRVSALQGLYIEVFPDNHRTWIEVNEDAEDDATDSPRSRCGDIHLRNVRVTWEDKVYEGHIADRQGRERVIKASDGSTIYAQPGCKEVQLRPTFHRPDGYIVPVDFGVAA